MTWIRGRLLSGSAGWTGRPLANSDRVSVRRRRWRALRVLAVVVLGAGCTSPLTGLPSAAPTASHLTTAPAITSTAPATSSGQSGASASSVAPGCGQDPCYTSNPIADLPAGVATGASGVVASSASGVWFVVDDRPGTDSIEAIRGDGSLLATVPVAGMSARNAEALTAGRCSTGAGRCLLIGDIGDNTRSRADVVVYELAEPAAPFASARPAPVPARVWRFQYPDGPHNAEAMFAEPNGALIIITKSEPAGTGTIPPHRIYRGRPGGGQLTFVSQFVPPDPAVRLQSWLTGTVVTDAAVAPGRVLLLTYDEVVEYRAASPTADPAGFPSWPHRELPTPRLLQAEGIAMSRTGCGYLVVSERGPGGGNAAIGAVSCRAG